MPKFWWGLGCIALGAGATLVAFTVPVLGWFVGMGIVLLFTGGTLMTQAWEDARQLVQQDHATPFRVRMRREQEGMRATEGSDVKPETIVLADGKALDSGD